jgi:dolichol-phosphate mannosyltransferase
MTQSAVLKTAHSIDSQEALPAIELALVVPTLNEADNIPELVARLSRVLDGIGWEIVFVDDDSVDRSLPRIHQLALRDRRVRCLHRIGRRGLSSACIEGMLATPAPYIAVMDADLQHDETRLPEMLKLLRHSSTELVVGSRYVAGGSTGDLAPSRISLSRWATHLSRLICRQPISDPMSGFFMIRKEAFESAMRRLSGLGFKILLDLMVSAPRPLKVAEIPYVFKARTAGESKLDSRVLWEFGMLLLDKTVGRYVPVRFLSFAAVGASGVLVHMLVLSVTFKLLGYSFVASQVGAIVTSIIFNFWINNLFTYRDRRLRGWKWLGGLTSFAFICSIGAVANVGIASYLYANKAQWTLAALAGVIVGAVWNYAITQRYTWNSK